MKITNEITMLQAALAPVIEELRAEHKRLAPRAKTDKQAADEQVSVSAMLLSMTRANRELTKTLTAFDWYNKRVLPKRKTTKGGKQ